MAVVYILAWSLDETGPREGERNLYWAIEVLWEDDFVYSSFSTKISRMLIRGGILLRPSQMYQFNT